MFVRCCLSLHFICSVATPTHPYTLSLHDALPISGFMIATGFLSMWVSNTAPAVLMLPIGLSVLILVNETMERSGDVSSLSDAGDAQTEGPRDGSEGESSDSAEASAATKSSLLQSKFGTG